MQGPRYTGKRARREERLHETRLRQALADLTDCSVCLSTCVEPHALRACGHTFCATCLENWLGRAKTCPVCRAPASMHDAERANGLASIIWWGLKPLMTADEQAAWLGRRKAYHSAVAAEMLRERGVLGH